MQRFDPGLCEWDAAARRRARARQAAAGLFFLATLMSLATRSLGSDTESAAEAQRRHRRVSARREAVHLICHRGVAEFAHENTLEAYRAAFELGADGNEVDIRATKDGVLVCFHDDMLDHLLEGYGDVADYDWEALRRIPFRNPGRFAEHCRIPTLRETFSLHRRHAGLLHLDLKRPELVAPISKLLDEFDMWDHVVQASSGFDDARYKPTRGKASLYLDRGEVDEAAIVAALERPGDRILLEYPRRAAMLLGRRPATPSKAPATGEVAAWAVTRASSRDPGRSVADLLRVLGGADSPEELGGGDAATLAAAQILARARAADALARGNCRSAEVFQALEARARNRSLHHSWRFCGLDGASAVRALFRLQAPNRVAVARFCLWRDDAAVESVRNAEFNSPRSWTDWRTKTIVFGLLESAPGPETVRLCRDYLALSDEEARRIGVPQYEAAARAMLATSPTAATVRELLSHRLRVVRGRAILFCLSRLEEPWIGGILRDAAPFALKCVHSGPVRIALVGDSTVASYASPPADRPEMTGWGQVLGEFFTDQVQVLNHARSGRSSKSFINEGHWKRTLALEPDYVLIQFGHNDQPGKGEERTTDPQGDFRDWLRRYVVDARAAGIKPVLVTPVSRRHFQGGKIRSTLGPWALAMREVGEREGVPVLDLHGASVRLLDSLGDEGSADLSASPTDRTHFSRKGAMAMARLVADALREEVPLAAGLLRRPAGEGAAPADR